MTHHHSKKKTPSSKFVVNWRRNSIAVSWSIVTALFKWINCSTVWHPLPSRSSNCQHSDKLAIVSIWIATLSQHPNTWCVAIQPNFIFYSKSIQCQRTRNRTEMNNHNLIQHQHDQRNIEFYHRTTIKLWIFLI